MLPRLRRSLLYYWKSKQRIRTDRNSSLKKGGFWYYSHYADYGYWVQTKKFGGKLTNGSARACPLRGRIIRQLRIKRRSK